MFLGKFSVVFVDIDSELAVQHLAKRHQNLLLLILSRICGVQATQEIFNLTEMV